MMTTEIDGSLGIPTGVLWEYCTKLAPSIGDLKLTEGPHAPMAYFSSYALLIAEN